jgi:putative spermidine/putrescine transport system permease protein
MNRHAAQSRTIGLLTLSVLALSVAAPFAAFALNAFSFRWFYPQLWPREWSLRAWLRILSVRSGLLQALGTSLGLGFAVTLVSLAIGLPAARALGMRSFRGKRLVQFIILAPVMVPSMAVGMGLSVLFVRLGLGGTWLGVALVHLVPVLPYVILPLSGTFRNYDDCLEAQARTLGAGPVRVFLEITIPAIFPGLVVAGLFAFLISFSQYLLTMLIGGGRVVSLPVLLFSSIPGGDNPAIAALSLVFVLPSVFILVFTSRYLSGGSSAMQGLGRI